MNDEEGGIGRQMNSDIGTELDQRLSRSLARRYQGYRLVQTSTRAQKSVFQQTYISYLIKHTVHCHIRIDDEVYAMKNEP